MPAGPCCISTAKLFTGDEIGTALIDLNEGNHLAIACPGQACELAVRSFGRVLQDGFVEG